MLLATRSEITFDQVCCFCISLAGTVQVLTAAVELPFSYMKSLISWVVFYTFFMRNRFIRNLEIEHGRSKKLLRLVKYQDLENQSSLLVSMKIAKTPKFKQIPRSRL